jgi:chromosome segregation ATPase
MALKNKVKLSRKVEKIFSGTEVGVLVEEFTSKVTLVAEQYLDIKKDTSSIKEDISSIKEDVEIIKIKVDKNTDDIEAIKINVSKNTDDIEAIKINVSKNTDDIEAIKTDVEFIKDGLKKKVDYDEFVVLERRVALLENRR